tara:strand:+ start:157 stop:654 length:498 start_codon:yes stop_codon:yes gene_type:complete
MQFNVEPIKIAYTTEGDGGDIHPHQPQIKSSGAAGYDIRSTDTVIIPPHSNAVVGTGIRLELPQHMYATIESRSGLAFAKGPIRDGHQTHRGVTAFRGIIDSDYRGEIKVLLFNNSPETATIIKGSRVAQMIFHQHIRHQNIVFSEVQELGNTERGNGGFGSTGI